MVNPWAVEGLTADFTDWHRFFFTNPTMVSPYKSIDNTERARCLCCLSIDAGFALGIVV